MAAFYNEINSYAAQWLRNLIDAGHIAPGVVDERDIRDIRPEELHPYDQCHFFAGIGVWSHALRGAGWADDQPVWTGSCPCQPFSAAGAGGGFADERHLWPHFHWLIAQCRPPVVLGEQVASKDGLGWLDLVQADMEGSGYAFGANDLCAAGIGAPHIRQRLWFVGVEYGAGNGWDERRTESSGRRAASGCSDGWLADTEREQRQQGWTGEARDEPGSVERVERLRDDGWLADTDGRKPRQTGPVQSGGEQRQQPQDGRVERLADTEYHDGRSDKQRWGPQGRVADGWRGADGWMADAVGGGCEGPSGRGGAQGERTAERSMSDGSRRSCPTDGFWRDADWLFCRDGRWRPVEPGSFPLAHGATARVGRLRAYGNAIVAPLAQTFVETVMECL